MVETESGTYYTSPFFLLAAVLWAPKLASGKKFSGTAACTRGNPAATPENTKAKTRCGYDFASDHCVFVKNHLGSTVRTVDDRGRYNNGSEKAYDYLAYGTSKLLKTGSDTTDVRQKFTGKEYEALTGLYAFGARWHDPELGMWMSPDPRHQYFNPYSYVGGNAPNLTDPDGLCAGDDPNCTVLPTSICDCPEGGGDCTPSTCNDPPPSGGIVETVIGLGSLGVTGGLLVACIIFCDDDDDDGGSSAPAPNSTPTPQPTSAPSSDNSYNQKFNDYWNRGENTINQATHWENGERMVDDIPQYLDGLVDKFHALPYYGQRSPDPNVKYGVIPWYVSGPGGAGGLPSSRALGQVLEASGYVRPAGAAAHHIVAGGAEAASPARAILNKFGIGINSVENGVFLPANSAAENAANAAVHSTLHTNSYYQTVNEMLRQASTPEEAKAVLEAIRKKLLSGGTGY